MAYIQIHLTDPATQIEENTEDVLAVSRDTGGILVLKGERVIVRVALTKTEAAHIVARLTPHIP
jgi:hypothetical protein